MGRMPWAVYLWPGLPRLWRRGDWSGLFVAVGFAAMLNLAMVTSLVWTEFELFAPGGRTILWLTTVVVWAGSALFSMSWQRYHPDPPEVVAAKKTEDVFNEALGHYLQQNWYEAERILGRLLWHNARDVDARLMLASVLRHTGRYDEAAGHIDRLCRIEGSHKWEQEIDRERALLAEAIAESGDEATRAGTIANEHKQAA